MLLAVKFFEILLILIIVISIFALRVPRKKDTVVSEPSESAKRFNSEGHDICDGEYEEIR